MEIVIYLVNSLFLFWLEKGSHAVYIHAGRTAVVIYTLPQGNVNSAALCSRYSLKRSGPSEQPMNITLIDIDNITLCRQDK